jgi:hypothetical protein
MVRPGSRLSIQRHEQRRDDLPHVRPLKLVAERGAPFSSNLLDPPPEAADRRARLARPMAARPDDDARRTLAELEAKLRELERELLRGRDPEPPPPAAEPAPPEPPLGAEPTPEPEPLPEQDTPHAAEPAPTPEPFPEAAHARPGPLAAEPEPFAEQHTPQLESLGADAEPAPLEPFPEPSPPPEPPAPAEPPPPELDVEALADAQDLLADLRATIDELGATAGRITVEARAVVESHGRSLARLDLAARAAARAEEAAAEAGRVAGTVVIEAGPFAEPGPLLALRDALAAQPGTKDAYVRGVEDGRAVIEVHLAPPGAETE